MIEPGVGASTCASGSHICKGNMGIFIANPKNKKIQISNNLSVKQ